jgi:hypothetical protein
LNAKPPRRQEKNAKKENQPQINADESFLICVHLRLSAVKNGFSYLSWRLGGLAFNPNQMT